MPATPRTSKTRQISQTPKKRLVLGLQEPSRWRLRAYNLSELAVAMAVLFVCSIASSGLFVTGLSLRPQTGELSKMSQEAQLIMDRLLAAADNQLRVNDLDLNSLGIPLSGTSGPYTYNFTTEPLSADPAHFVHIGLTLRDGSNRRFDLNAVRRLQPLPPLPPPPPPPPAPKDASYYTPGETAPGAALMAGKCDGCHNASQQKGSGSNSNIAPAWSAGQIAAAAKENGMTVEDYLTARILRGNGPGAPASTTTRPDGMPYSATRSMTPQAGSEKDARAMAQAMMSNLNLPK